MTSKLNFEVGGQQSSVDIEKLSERVSMLKRNTLVFEIMV